MPKDDLSLIFVVDPDLVDEIDSLIHSKDIKIGVGIGSLVYLILRHQAIDVTCRHEFEFRVSVLKTLIDQMADVAYTHEKEEQKKEAQDAIRKH